MKETTGIIKPQKFKRRLDFYLKYISAYAIFLLIFVLLGVLFENKPLVNVLKSPFVLLISGIIGVSALSLFFKKFKKLSITVAEDFIVFKSRFREKKYCKDDIIKISIIRERLKKVDRRAKVIKIVLKNRRRALRIRPTSFLKEHELIKAVKKLKKNLFS
ncbi:MAG: hypothetical protein PF588_02055 [Candidatus Kapabacteria bacterium]|jgi:hypothetical protein|nr:hypothetical protein [Candidatus Kapabacteria bacterium]